MNCCICLNEETKARFFCSTCNDGNICIDCYKHYNKLICPCCKTENTSKSVKYYKEDMKIYLNVTYQQKDEAKALGCKFDFEKKQWYILENHENKNKVVGLYVENKTYLFVPYKYKDNVKALGCKFDIEKKKWYILKNNENYDEAVNLYHSENFRDGYMVYNTKSLKDIEDIEDNRRKLKIEWINRGDDVKEFEIWYSVNYNHE